MIRRYVDRNLVLNRDAFLMRSFVFSMLFCVSTLMFLAFPAFAEEMPIDPKGKTEILVNDKTDTVSIIINGEVVVVIDEGGLHAKKNITYDGSISDTGHSPKRTVGDETPGKGESNEE